MVSPFRESRKDTVEVARLFPREGIQQRTAEEIALRRFTSRSRKLAKTEIVLKIDQELTRGRRVATRWIKRAPEEVAIEAVLWNDAGWDDVKGGWLD